MNPPSGPRISRSAQSSVSSATRRNSGSPVDLPAVQVGAGEQRVVVEHLLEVGDEPAVVHRVAREAAAHLVVHAARRPSRAACGRSSRSRRGAAGTRSPRRAGTSGAPPKPPCLGVVRSRAAPSRARVQHRRVERLAPRAAAAAPPRRRSATRSPLARISSARSCQAADDRLEHRAPAGHPVALLGREVGARVEGHLLGREEHVQRPAAARRSSPGRPPCRSRPGRAAPRGRA